MNDNDFKMEVLQRLTRIETRLESMPQCVQREVLDKIKVNRRLIFLMLLVGLTGIISVVSKMLFGV